MGVQLFTNGASSTLSGTLSQGGTTMTLAAGTGSKFPSITGSDFFLVTLFTKDVGGVEQNIEVVKATARVGDTLTIVRDFENITGQSGGFAYDGNATTVFVHLRWTASSATGMLQKSGNLSGLADNAAARANIGLGNVNNTSDANKPVSTAQQAALDTKAPLANPSFTGGISTPAINGGGSSGFKNKIINGCMRISKKGNGAAALGANYYGADGIITVVGGWSAISGANIARDTLAINDGRFSTGAVHYLSMDSATGASGYVVFLTRIEVADAQELGGKGVTVAARLHAWATAPSNYYFRIYKANAVNDFSDQTLVSQSASFGSLAVNTTATPSHTFTIPAGDCLTGLQVELVVNFTGAVAANTFVFLGDFQFCEGSKAMPFELRPIAIEEQLRSRYYRKQVVWVDTSTARTCFPINMVKTPTLSGGGAGFTSTGTTSGTLMCYQTTAAAQTLTLDAEL